MTLFYLDSSAWVKRPQSEAGSLWMSRLWRPGVPFACATLGLVEVLCTIARRHAANSVDPSLTAAVLKSVHEDFEAFVRVELDDATLRVAESLAPTRRPRGADCIHLASAIRLRDSSGAPIILIASDAELIAAAAAEGFSTLDPAADPPLPIP